MRMIKAGIVGGTGYTGVELLRLLSQHPQVELVAITSRQEAGTAVSALFPSLRVGFVVAEQEVERADGSMSSLAFELSKVKSLTTVNTPPLLQAVVGGTILAEGGTLRALVERKLPFYRANRDRMLAALSPLSQEEYTRELGSSFTSVQDTLGHVYSAEWAWHQRWTGTSPTSQLPRETFPDVATVRRLWEKTEADVRGFTEALTHDDGTVVVAHGGNLRVLANGLGLTLIPEMAVEAGLLNGTNVQARPLNADHATREIALIWRTNSPRREEFEMLAQALRDLHRS